MFCGILMLKLFCRCYVTALNKLMQMKYEKCCTTVTELLRSARKISITMDIWTKKGYMRRSWCIGCVLIPCSTTTSPCASQSASHSHPNNEDAIVDFLQRSLTQWQIDPQKILFVVTDNESNMVKAVRILSAVFQLNMSESAIDEDIGEDEDIEQDEQR